MKFCRIAVPAFVCLASTSWGAIRYVNHAAVGANNGTSWANAFTNVSQALAVAAAGDLIWVAKGRYVHPTGAFVLVSGVKVYGGFAGGETLLSQRNPLSNPTTLSGDVAANDGANFTNRGDNRLNVVTAAGCNAATTLDGFTISGGYGLANGNGLSATACTFTVANCIFKDNYNAMPFGNNGGAGVYVNGGAMSFAACTFSGNMCELEDGAGVLVTQNATSLTMDDCTFSANRCGFPANAGASIANGVGLFSRTNTTLRGCTFSGNTAYGSGGGAGSGVGAYVNSFNLVIQNCDFLNNESFCTGAGSGSGVGLWASATTQLNLTDCDFVQNRATGGTQASGAGLSLVSAGNSQITSCLFQGNENLFRGGGAWIQGNATLADCTFVQNISASGGGLATLGTVSISGCRVSANQATSEGGGLYATSSTISVTSSQMHQNTATLNGGGIYANLTGGTLTNLALSGNGAGNLGAAAYISDLVNTRPWTIKHVSSAGQTGNGWHLITTPLTGLNCIVRDSATLANGATASFTYSNLQGPPSGAGNIDVAPLFVNLAGNDLHLLPQSPCVDAGFNNGSLPLQDFEGDGRILDGDLNGISRPDMGADEVAPYFQTGASITVIVGEFFDGDLSSVALSDDLDFSAFNDSLNLTTTVQLTGTVSPSPTQLRQWIEFSAERLGLAAQFLQYNFATNAWQVIGGRVAPSTDTQYLSLPLSGDYVGTGGAILARIQTSPINDEDPAVDGWLTTIDRWGWIVYP